MRKLLHIAEVETRKLQTKQKEIDEPHEVEIYLDWGRNGEHKLQLITTIENVPQKIMHSMRRKEI